MTLDNPQRLFKPAMLTTMTLVDGAERKLVLPTTAVVREGNDDCVFVKTGPNTFTLRTLKLAEDTGEKRVVMEGLQPNEEVVLEGAFHLNNERKRQALGGSEGS
jgi:cobalt-zinc-cadmium efflux system membrane fusion protein